MLTEPNAESIKRALFDLLDHPEKLALLRKHAVETAKSFSKERWARSWWEVIQNEVEVELPHVEKAHVLKRCILHVDSIDDLNLPEVGHFIHDHLEMGWYVFIACENNPLKYQSFQRLQFIDQDEDLYFEPEREVFVREIRTYQ